MSNQAKRGSDSSFRNGLRFEREFAIRFCDAVGSDAANEQKLRIESGKNPCELHVRSYYYQEPEQFAEDYQVAELLTKSYNIEGFDLAARKSAALSKFLAAELHNARTNERLWESRMPDWFGDFSYQLLRILGPLDANVLERIKLSSTFGPGTNVGLQGGLTVPSYKYETVPTVTANLAPLLESLFPAQVLQWHMDVNHTPSITRGNSHFTVPKNYKIERCAAKEPLWNSFLQLGIGRHMAHRLKRFGVDITDQKRNQDLAALAYTKGLATIDLSSASDLMARNLVTLALTYNGDLNGRRWLHLLNLARSHEMRIGKEWKALEMFSSMGNGFTFPLESAIFLSVVRSVVQRELWTECAVYGDDIIVPQNMAHEVIQRLEFLGFQVNLQKTCLAGVFFESCGADFFKGRNVRPFYLRQDPRSGIPYPLQAANALRAWCIRIYGYLPGKYRKVWTWCKGQVPQAWRYPVPKELGDVGLHVGETDAKASGIKTAHATFPFWEGYVVTRALLRPKSLERMTWGVLMSACAAISERGDGEGLTFLETMNSVREPTYGKEPVRGLFGRVRTENSVVSWKDDFCWVDAA